MFRIAVIGLAICSVAACNKKELADVPLARPPELSLEPRDQARHDLAAGDVHLLCAESVILPASIRESDPRIREIPRKFVPAGCFPPDATFWSEYAADYNAVVVAHIFRNQPTH
jgi:hypothetical protein